VNDAFGTAHRKHASNVGIAQNIATSCIGYLIEKELTNLSKITHNPKRPVVAVLGGAKVSDKLKVISNLLNIADHILICGGMAYTFLKAQGYDVGTSLLEEEMIPEAKRLLELGKDKIVLTSDFYITKEFADNKPEYKKLGYNLNNEMALDIGKSTIDAFNKIITTAGTIF
jgi:phosphoglycerate kinase